MKKMFILTFAALLVSSSTSISAQTGCPSTRLQPTVTPYDSLKYKLLPKTRFSIKMDNALNGGAYRTGDIVKFTVIENVYGLYTGKSPSKPAPPTPGAPKPEVLDDMQLNELLLVIPKGAQGFGRVNYAKRRSSFYYRGKAKIYVIPEYVQTDDGRCFEVRIPIEDTKYITSPQNIKPCKHQPENLKKDVKREKLKLTDDKDERANLTQCVEGRRPKIPFSTGIFGAAAAAALAVTKDDATGAVAGLTLINEASGNEGISTFLSGRDAEIGDTLIIEVEIAKENMEGFTKGNSPKKEEKKDKN